MDPLGFGLEGFDAAEIQAVFRAGSKTLPSYASAALPDGGYAVYKITSVSSDEKITQQNAQIVPLSLRQIFSDQTVSAYLDSLLNVYLTLCPKAI